MLPYGIGNFFAYCSLPTKIFRPQEECSNSGKLMIPISLTIKGIYSYQQEQTIDFQKLTDAQLFGIFGPVGSGKSTILEAISFALYNDTERLNRDNRNYNMMNLKSNELLIRFNFNAGAGFREEYLFEVRLI